MGLSTSDVEGLVETLESGKHPKVVFTDAAGQISGKVGKVVRLNRPAEGDFVVVAFGNDELPFTAEEVRVPERGELNRKPARKKTEAKPAEVPAPAGAPLLNESPAPASARRDNSRKSSARTVKETTSMNDEQPSVPKQNDGPEPAAAPAAAQAAPKKRAAKAKQAPELTVTLSWKDNEWSVSASKGTKVIAKPVPVKPSTAVSMVQSLDSPAVAAVVEDIVEQQRQEVADQAERLREELAAAEARLAELAQ
ncbi:hypothetical protein Snas_3186 [Stackebrandtia nassauensis DSM 44728]|uniref:Uncharacterized protein n=2 Tax=Stackebrandtia TaxID=283810 RepID=D3QBH4_STANL|nr:hypothetical protein Snas_3186 [Stackebrandtia nassauensis DSM 44728]